MNSFIVACILMGYLAIGFIMHGFLMEDWEKPALSIVIGWPIAAFMLLCGGFIELFTSIGKWLKNKLEG